jgi:hypothetical protein
VASEQEKLKPEAYKLKQKTGKPKSRIETPWRKSRDD